MFYLFSRQVGMERSQQLKLCLQFSDGCLAKQKQFVMNCQKTSKLYIECCL